LWGKFVLKESEPGWASIIVSVLFLGGIQLISLGFIGEYLSRISSNVKKRPLYVVEDSNIED
jgi:dolichol-phosphate mannosyltransferase